MVRPDRSKCEQLSKEVPGGLIGEKRRSPVNGLSVGSDEARDDQRRERPIGSDAFRIATVIDRRLGYGRGASTSDQLKDRVRECFTRVPQGERHSRRCSGPKRKAENVHHGPSFRVRRRRMSDVKDHPTTEEPPAVTVCVTCYNQERYIGQCLDGILAQDFAGPMEILVGDDASTDGSAEAIEAYARRDRRITLIRRPQNRGFIGNQRDLFDRAAGEFVAICEADDYWIDPHKLSRQVEAIRARPDVGLSITAGIKVSEDGAYLGDLRISDVSRDLDLAELIREANGRVPTASMLMRRSALRALPEETYRQIVIDYSLQVLLGLRGALYDATPSIAYRLQSRGSWSEGLAQSAEKFRKHHEASREHQQFLERQLGPEWTPELRKSFEAPILGFYMSSRIPAADKARNLPKDLPRLSWAGRMLAATFTRMPLVVLAGAFARRKLWRPLSRAFRPNRA